MKGFDYHDLKTWGEDFQAIQSGEKTFEVRQNDQDFKVGDILRLKEYDPVHDRYTARYIPVEVTYILVGGQFGVKDGYCVMGFKESDGFTSSNPQRNTK